MTAGRVAVVDYLPAPSPAEVEAWLRADGWTCAHRAEGWTRWHYEGTAIEVHLYATRDYPLRVVETVHDVAIVRGLSPAQVVRRMLGLS